MTNIPDGYGFVAGRSRETAKAILAAAEAAGVDAALVRTVTGGYIAPDEAVRQYEGKGQTQQGEVSEAEEIEPDEYDLDEEGDEKVELSEGDRPDKTWKVGDIRSWANTNGVDVGDATSKTDLLAAINSADTKEE
jgi:hypothetical protein